MQTMLGQLAKQSSFQNEMMMKNEEQHCIAQQAQIKAAKQTNNILLEVMKQNKNVAEHTSTIGKMADLNMETTRQLRLVERKAAYAEKEAAWAKKKAEQAITAAKGAEEKAEQYKIEREAALAKIHEMDIINNPEKAMATALESKIIDNPDRFRGKTGIQGEEGIQGEPRARGVAGYDGKRGERGPGFWWWDK